MTDLAALDIGTATSVDTSELQEKPKRRRRHRADPDGLWAVVTLPDGSKQAYTRVTRAIEVAQQEEVTLVELCAIVPKTRGMKVVQTITV